MGHEFQPDRVTARIPFRADIRPGPDGGVEAEFLGRFQESLEIPVADKIEMTFGGLVKIPERTGLHAGEIGLLQAPQPVFPKLMRNPRVVNRAGRKIGARSVDDKSLVIVIDGRPRRRRRGVHEVVARGFGGCFVRPKRGQPDAKKADRETR